MKKLYGGEFFEDEIISGLKAAEKFDGPKVCIDRLFLLACLELVTFQKNKLTLLEACLKDLRICLEKKGEDK